MFHHVCQQMYNVFMSSFRHCPSKIVLGVQRKTNLPSTDCEAPPSYQSIQNVYPPCYQSIENVCPPCYQDQDSSSCSSSDDDDDSSLSGGWRQPRERSFATRRFFNRQSPSRITFRVGISTAK